MTDNQNKKRRVFMFILIIETLMLFTLALKMYIKPVVTISIPLTEGTPALGHMEEDGYHFDDSDGEKVEAYAPIFFHLNMPIQKGSYTLTVNYLSSAGSRCGVIVNDKYHDESYIPSPEEYIRDTIIECDDIALDHNTGTQIANIIVNKDTENMDFFVKYCGFQAFRIYDATLSSNHRDIIPFIIKFLFFITLANVSIYLFLFKNILPNSSPVYRDIIYLFILSIIVSLPLFVDYLPLFDDFAFDYIKIDGIMNGLKDRQFPVRIHPSTLHNYGYALPYFYPELFCYFPAVLRILGFSVMDSYKIFVFFVNLSTSLVAYYSINTIYSKRIISLIGSFVYTLSIYRLFDVYRRGSIGEYLAMIFLPLIIMGFYRIITEQKWIPFFIGLTGLFSSHILSIEMVGLFSIIACIICIKSLLNKQIILSFLKALTSSIAVTLCFWIPFIDMLNKDTYKVFTSEPYSVLDNTLSFNSLYQLLFEKDSLPGVGLVFVLSALLFLVIFCLNYFNKRNAFLHTSANSEDSTTNNARTTTTIQEKRQKLIFSLICTFLGLLALFITMNIFPWSVIENSNGFIKTILCMVQFPWRYLSLASILLTFSLCGAIDLIDNRIVNIVIIVISAILSLVSALFFFHSVLENATRQYFYNSCGIMTYWGTGMGEYEPDSFDGSFLNVDNNIYELQQLLDKDYYTKQENGAALIIESFEKNRTKSTLVVANQTNESQILYLPYLYYYGYQANNIFDNPDNLVPTLFESEYGVLALEIPAGYYNGIHISYKEPFLYRLSELISLFSLIAILYFQTGNYIDNHPNVKAKEKYYSKTKKIR